ncbi:Uncharacterised protein [Halioglobus japonicus]|nr:Uncharacterised protein [Halioglobus japonicus]
MAERAMPSKVYGLRHYVFPRAPERLDIAKRWCLTDSRKAYRRRPHPLFGRWSIKYTLNHLGYRCAEFDQDIIADPSCFKLVVIGGSETFGVGLPADKLYVNLLATRLEHFTGKKVIAWNIGLPMAGSSFISRMLYPIIELLSPDFLFLNFPAHSGYREYFNDDEEIFFCEPGGLAQRRTISRFWDPEASRVDRAHLSLESDFNNTVSFYNDYCYCEFLCDYHGIDWLYSAPDIGGDTAAAVSFTPRKRVASRIHQFMQAGVYGESDEDLLARDFIHPGILPNQRFADAVLDAYVAGYSSGGRL